MIHFKELGQYGRLGNQLFQYAAARSLAIRNETEVALEDLDTKLWHGQKCVMSNFNLKYVRTQNTPNIPTYFEDPSDYWKFNSNFFRLPREINLHGFFQNINYFSEIEDTIRSEFELKDQNLKGECKRFLSGFKNPVSIHLRLGDTLDQFSQHGYQEYLKDYVANACKHFDSDSDFLVISGGSRTSDDSAGYSWARQHITGKNFHYIEGNDPLKDFCLISNCNGNILGIDSTFSWWASYLNKNGRVVAPSKMPYTTMETTIKDWILI